MTITPNSRTKTVPNPYGTKDLSEMGDSTRYAAFSTALYPARAKHLFIIYTVETKKTRN
jgi:hypothetical protein